MLETIVYLLLFSIIFSILTIVMLRNLRRSSFPPDSDEDGGIGNGGDFPIIGVPPGGTIEDLLVDRCHGDSIKTNAYTKKT